MALATKALQPHLGHQLPSDEANDNMDTSLDFDLLAEYLLEDVGNGGFDFSGAEVVNPPTIDAPSAKPSQQPAAAALVRDPGVVTPHHSDVSYGGSVDVPVTTQTQNQLVQPQNNNTTLLVNGDMSRELSQVQVMMATTQPQVQVPSVPVTAQLQQPRITPPQTSVQAPAIATVPRNPLPVMRQPQRAASKAPTAPRPPPPKPAVASTISTQASKRPRTTAAPQSTMAKASAYSFAGSNTMSMATAAMAAQINKAHPMPPAPQPDARGIEKTQAQVDRRRERNRILARRTRLRKKFFFESLQKDVADLQRENAALKSIIRSCLKPDDAKTILNSCDAQQKMPSAVQSQTVQPHHFMKENQNNLTCGGGSSVRKLDREDFSLIQSIQNSQQCFIITDPSLHDNPIVYASDDFLKLTGYSQEEVLGRNCRFLQGTETCQNKVAQIRKAVAAGEDVSVTIANYTSEGNPFWNSLFIAALRDADNNIVNFIGVIVKVLKPEPGDSEYGKVLK